MKKYRWSNGSEKIKQNELITKKNKKVCRTLNCIEHLLILSSAVTGYISTSAFASLLGVPVSITISALGLKTLAVTEGLKKYKSTIKK